ncbi:hypothetical protein MASR2M39_10040 [Ignavibacteriales bacterium]
MNVALEKIKMEDLFYQNCLTWSVDGYAGTLFNRNETNILNEKKPEFYFTINNHSGILSKIDNLYLPFIKYIIQPLFYKISKGYGNNKVGTNQIKDIMVKIPINDKDEYDFEKQKDIALRYEMVRAKKTVR